MPPLGEPTEGKVVLGHFGALWLRIRVHGNFIHTAFSEGPRQNENSILRAHRVLDAILRMDPDVGERRVQLLPRREGDRERRRDRGRVRLARLAHSASHRRLPRHPGAADEADGRGAAPRCSTGCARSPDRFTDYGVEGEGHPTMRRARRSTRDTSSSPRSTKAHAEVFGGDARARCHPLVQRCVGAHALWHPDGELRHVDRPDGRREGREPRDRRARQDGGANLSAFCLL